MLEDTKEEQLIYIRPPICGPYINSPVYSQGRRTPRQRATAGIPNRSTSHTMTLTYTAVFVYVICCTVYAVSGHRCPEYPSLVNDLMDADCSAQLMDVLAVVCIEQSSGTAEHHGRVKRNEGMTRLVCECCLRSCSIRKLQEFCWLV